MWVLWTWIIGAVVSVISYVLVGASVHYFTLSNNAARDIQKQAGEDLQTELSSILLVCVLWPLFLVALVIWGFGHLFLVILKRLLYRFTVEGQEAKDIANR